ncbi:MAG: TIGR03032 family protein [Rhodobacteraceae bacterium]|nr:TIGR03032 family protein [Paracoccaceae bacterium]
MNLAAAEPTLSLTTSRLFPSWLAAHNASIAFTTYQAGKVFFVGVNSEQKLSIFERTIERPMALHNNGGSLYLSSLYQLWRFDDMARGELVNGYDRCFAPRQSWVTGDIDIHDVKTDASGRLVFVNTLFSCLATVSETDSFHPLWQPPFISKLAAEDRCHLNGLAMRDGRPAYVTAVSTSDVADGWRDRRVGGGVVISVIDNAIVAEGLSMPHSPRWRDGRIWLVNAGTGEIGFIDEGDSQFIPICFCPGFLRGLNFIGDFAVVTMSLPRGDTTFQGLPLQERLNTIGDQPRCGLAVIDLKTGDLAHWLRLEGVVSELFDAVVLPGATRPSAIGFRSDEIRRFLSVGEAEAI